MDNSLWFYISMDIKLWAQQIFSMLERCSNVEMSYLDKNEYVVIVCESFSIIIDVDDVSGVEMIENIFGFVGNVCMRIQLFNRYYYEGVEILIKLLRLIINERDEDFLLLENGELVVLCRQKGFLYTELPKEHSTEYPFELLGQQVHRM